MKKKIVIIGGVAGGANCATRARRLNEHAEILILERSGYVSFANCGLPYHVGEEITKREALLLNTPDTFRRKFNIEVRVRSEVIKIDPGAKTVHVKDLTTGSLYTAQYDELVISTGASPIIPPIPGVQLDGVFGLRNIEDMDRIVSWMKGKAPKRALVVGGGFIGIEIVEQLHRKGISLTMLEAAPQILAPLDPEMAALVHQEMTSKGIDIQVGDAIIGIEKAEEGFLRGRTSKGRVFDSDMIILAIGVKPESSLAKDAGLTIGSRGGITVNAYLQTSNPNIWAVGDVIEVTNKVTGEVGPIPLAGPANRQGRLVADNICGKQRKAFDGAIGTSIVRAFDLVAASTGVNQKSLIRLNKPFKTLFLYPNSHAGYYPGATTLSIKAIVDPTTRKLWGAQIVGKEGVDKRIDVLATAIKSNLTIDDLADLELSYAPPFSSAKDPVNMIGMAFQNMLDGLVEVVTPEELGAAVTAGACLLDVRDYDEVAAGMIPGAKHIPLTELRERRSELQSDKYYIVYCASAVRSYNATRLLSQSGFKVANLAGAYRAWKQWNLASSLSSLPSKPSAHGQVQAVKLGPVTHALR